MPALHSGLRVMIKDIERLVIGGFVSQGARRVQHCPVLTCYTAAATALCMSKARNDVVDIYSVGKTYAVVPWVL